MAAMVLRVNHPDTTSSATELYLVGDKELALGELHSEFGHVDLIDAVELPDSVAKFLGIKEETVLLVTDSWQLPGGGSLE